MALSNIEQQKKVALYPELHRALKDAIIVIREIGIHYLWIDFLCIIQKALEDGAVE